MDSSFVLLASQVARLTTDLQALSRRLAKAVSSFVSGTIKLSFFEYEVILGFLDFAVIALAWLCPGALILDFALARLQH
jgi:hypothetical protein